MATPRPNFQGGTVSIAPYLQGVTNVLLANQERAIQEAAAERERADKLYADVQSLSTKINPVGIMSNDYDDVMEIYQNGVKANMISANIARQQGDMAGYTSYLAKAQEEVMRVTQVIGASKDKRERVAKLRDGFDPSVHSEEYIPELDRIISTPITKTGGSIDDMLSNPRFLRQVDTSKVQSSIDKKIEDLRKEFSGSGEVKSTRIGTGTTKGTQYTREGEVPVGAVVAMLSYEENNPSMKRFFSDNYPGLTYQEAIMQYTEEQQALGRLRTEEKVATWQDRIPRSTEGSGVTGTSGSVITDVPIKYGSNTVASNKWVKLNNIKIGIPSVEALNSETGQIENLDYLIEEGVSDGVLVSLSEVPGFASLLGDAEVGELVVTVRNPAYSMYAGSRGMDVMAGVSPTITKRYYIGQDVIPRYGTNASAINNSLKALRSGATTPTTTQKNRNPDHGVAN